MKFSDADVFILAAGFGKRLRPLTDNIPKPLVKVGNRELISYHLSQLEVLGFKRVIVNSHYLANKLQEYLISFSKSSSLEIVTVFEEEILDTGGGIKNIEKLLNSEYLFTINSDAFFGSGLPLETLFNKHEGSGRSVDVTFLLKEVPSPDQYGIIGANSNGEVVKFLTAEKPNMGFKKYIYTGVQLLKTSLIAKMEAGVFSITRDFYLSNFCNLNIFAHEYKDYWNDCGTIDSIKDVEKFLSS